MAGALEMAGEIAARSPVAVQGTKLNLIYARDHSVAEGLNYMVRSCIHRKQQQHAAITRRSVFQATWNMSMLQTADVMKSAQASMEKKSPKDVVFSKL